MDPSSCPWDTNHGSNPSQQAFKYLKASQRSSVGAIANTCESSLKLHVDGLQEDSPKQVFLWVVGNKLLPLPLGSEAYVRDTDMEMKEASWSPGLGAPVQSRPH